VGPLRVTELLALTPRAAHPLGAHLPAPLCSRHVRSRSPLFRRQRDQARLLDPGASTDSQLPAGLESSAYRPAAGCPVRSKDGRAQPRCAAVGLGALLGQRSQSRFSNINAKAEGIENRPAFRDAFQRRRCLVPINNFFEWKRTPTGKQPYAIALADRRLMALAGRIGAHRKANGSGASLSSLVRRTSFAPSFTTGCRWFSALRIGRHGSGRSQPTRTNSRPCSYPTHSEEMVCWPVSTRVGNVKNNDPSLIRPQ
jgi:putative SOS response-associated peptidase YedK